MGALYPGTSVNGYNANPPPDDGTTIATNLVTWAGIKSKIGDPLNTFAAGVDSNLTAAFGKTLDGASIVSTAVDYPMTAADQGRLIVVTVAGKTVTTPDATVVGAPFTFSVSNQSTGTITIDGSGTQTVDGQLTQVIKAGSGCIIRTDGTNWFTFGLKTAQLTSVNPPYGFDAPINLGLVASVGSGILTVAIKTNSGADPTPGDPVLIPFRDVTIANGDPVWIAVTAALSITTNAIGATLGVPNSVPFRYWICAFNNSGTPFLALWQSGAASAAVAINPIDETSLQSATAISAAATAAGTFYCPNGTTITNQPVRKIGFLEYSAGLATLSGSGFTSAPTKLQLFGPGVAKPGDVVRSVFAAGTSLSITPTSAINLVRASANGLVNGTGSAAAIAANFRRGTTILQTGNLANNSTPFIISGVFPFIILDNPQSASSISYNFTGTNCTLAAGSTILLEEIMG